jgi:uncharacterized protein YjbI with pentapeptide repeats
MFFPMLKSSVPQHHGVHNKHDDGGGRDGLTKIHPSIGASHESARPSSVLAIVDEEAVRDFCEEDKPMSKASTTNQESRIAPDVYWELEAAPPEVRREIVLGLIREHPEGRLVLPALDGVRAILDEIVLSYPAQGLGLDSAAESDRRQKDGRLGLSLRRAALRGASLRMADLRGVDLEEAGLQEVELEGADLRGATLRHADLSRSRLVGANLAGANLAGADLRGALLDGADLGGADLANARLEGASLGKSDLRGALLEEANLDHTSVRFAKLQGAILEGAYIRRADLRGADLEDADLRGADLEGSELEETRLRASNFAGANLRSCLLRQADLREADMTGADLRGSVLTGANLRYAVLRDARLQEVGLSQCEIAHISLGGAKLDDTQLLLKQLDGAIGEELAGDFDRAAQGYLALERNFEGLGDHDAASWAYRRRRRMQKREALAQAQAARSGRRWRRALGWYTLYASDQLVEWMCDYGESVPRVLGSLAVVYAAFTLIYTLTGSVVREPESLGEIVRGPTRNPIVVAIFSLLVMTTGSPEGGLAPRGDLTLLLMGIEAFVGIALTGLLGFVLGNRIRR